MSKLALTKKKKIAKTHCFFKISHGKITFFRVEKALASNCRDVTSVVMIFPAWFNTLTRLTIPRYIHRSSWTKMSRIGTVASLPFPAYEYLTCTRILRRRRLTLTPCSRSRHSRKSVHEDTYGSQESIDRRAEEQLPSDQNAFQMHTLIFLPPAPRFHYIAWNVIKRDPRHYVTSWNL